VLAALAVQTEQQEQLEVLGWLLCLELQLDNQAVLAVLAGII
jgi:hypothetical protein